MSLSYINSLFATVTGEKCPKEVEKVICTYILTIQRKKTIVHLLQFMPTMAQCEKWEKQAVNITRSNDIRKKTEHFRKINKSYPYLFTLFQAPVPNFPYGKRKRFAIEKSSLDVNPTACVAISASIKLFSH